MDAKGLFLGIDIGESISQVCCYDEKSRNILPVLGKDDSPYFQNMIPLSKIFENETTAPERLASMIQALTDAVFFRLGKEKISAIGLCLHDISEEKRRIWSEALSIAGVDRSRYILMGCEETFAYYAFSGEPAGYTRGVVLYDLSENGLKGCFLQRVSYKGFTILTENDESTESELIKKAGSGAIPLKEAENELIAFFKSTLEKNTVSSIYLTGEPFEGADLPEDVLSILGKGGHRIYAGMNLYVKGACIGAISKVIRAADPFRIAGLNKTQGTAGNLSVCIMACRNRISSEISLTVREKGETKRKVIVERGSNVDDSFVTFECIPGERGEIQFIVEPLTQNTPDIYTVKLRSGKDFSKEIVRLKVQLYFSDEDHMTVTVESAQGEDDCDKEIFEADLLGKGGGASSVRTDGVILCRCPKTDIPYVFPATGEEIYSAEELVKCLYENIYLTGVDGGVFNNDLFSFLRERAGCGETADKVQELWESGGSLKETLLTVFREINYYSPKDIVIIEPVIDGLKTGKRALVKYGRAEAYIERGCLTKALKELREIMELNPDSELPEKFYAKVLYNAGVCYARCMMYEKAGEMFEGSYGFVKDEKTKDAALFARALSGTEPGILFMKGEWENAGQRAKEFREEIEKQNKGTGDPAMRLESIQQRFITKYS